MKGHRMRALTSKPSPSTAVRIKGDGICERAQNESSVTSKPSLTTLCKVFYKASITPIPKQEKDITRKCRPKSLKNIDTNSPKILPNQIQH